MTVAQLTVAWSSELAEGGEDPKHCEQNLGHILMEDIVNGRLDDSGPLVDGRRLGLTLVAPRLPSLRVLSCLISSGQRRPGFFITSWSRRRRCSILPSDINCPHLHGGPIPPACLPLFLTTQRSLPSNPIPER